MMSGQPFLPLYFEEEDHDLWQVLAAIPPENRAQAVKSALRQAFMRDATYQNESQRSLSHHGFSHLNASELSMSDPGEIKLSPDDLSENNYSTHENTDSEDNNPTSNDTESPESAESAPNDLTEYTLEDLFIPTAAYNEDPEISNRPKVGTPNEAGVSPWENLLYNIIGTEDDEEVILTLRKANQ